jgi:hypothetical protein
MLHAGAPLRRIEADKMRRCKLGFLALTTIGLGLGGCGQPPVARYVYQDGEFGVVAIPVNTSLDRVNYRSQADALMARHFPEGYEIVRAEEVNEGERTLDVGKKTELETNPTVSAWDQMIKLGKLNRSTSFEEKEKLQLRECRIIYKRRSVKAQGPHAEFSALAALSPPFYVDPNELMRRQLKADLLAKANPAAKKAGDENVQKAGADPTVASDKALGPARLALSPDW